MNDHIRFSKISLMRHRKFQNIGDPSMTGKFMVLDSSTRRNLELVETLWEKALGSFYLVLDKTKTAMGARMLRSFCGTAID